MILFDDFDLVIDFDFVIFKFGQSNRQWSLHEPDTLLDKYCAGVDPCV